MTTSAIAVITDLAWLSTVTNTDKVYIKKTSQSNHTILQHKLVTGNIQSRSEAYKANIHSFQFVSFQNKSM